MAKRSAIVIILLFVLGYSLNAQDKPKKVYRPDIPGSFIVDFGFNSGLNKPQYFNQGFWGSRTLNVYYHYPVRISQSKFSYNPGAGFSFERFRLTNNYTLSPQADNTGEFQLIDPTSSNNSGSISFLSAASVKKSMLVANYFDLMPVEFRYDTNPKDVSRGFNLSIGARFGVLIESHTKIKYSENGVNASLKDKQQHGLNPFRYGIYGRVGIGNFNWFWMYNLSPYFATGKGPAGTNMNTMTIGISLNGF